MRGVTNRRGNYKAKRESDERGREGEREIEGGRDVYIDTLN
jgi:hypothetical protein